MRQYVRRWINEWDLRRLYPDYAPAMSRRAASNIDYDEHPDLERRTDGGDGDRRG